MRRFAVVLLAIVLVGCESSGGGFEEPGEDTMDRAFYRNYRKMPTETKKKIRKMVKIWSEGG